MEGMNHYNNMDIDFGLSCQDLTYSDGSSHFTCEPYIEIIEQPRQRGFRFRYGCEGPSHGGLPGVSSERNKKTYPTVKIHNYTGPAKIMLQLVTVDEPAFLHVHSLVGRQCRGGTCVVRIDSEDMTASFPNLGILHVPKKEVATIIEDQLLRAWSSEGRDGQESPLDRNGGNPAASPRKQPRDEDREKIHVNAQKQAKCMDLSVVRLMFTPYLLGSDDKLMYRLSPAISDPIYDSKAPNASSLRIVRMARTAGSVTGGDEVFLLCEKVQKDDVQVRFYEEDGNGQMWEAFGKFSPTDVHRQFAIVFRTPKYYDVHIAKPVSVLVQLRRRSDGESSEPTPFIYYPSTQDKDQIQKKWQKVPPDFPNDFEDAATERRGVYSHGLGSEHPGSAQSPVSGFINHEGCNSVFGPTQGLQFPAIDDKLKYFPTAELSSCFTAGEVGREIVAHNYSIGKQGSQCNVECSAY